MAIEKTYLLGKNITLGCGFDLQAKAPLDSRQIVPEYAGLQALIDGNAAYEGMIVYDEETKKTYQAQIVDGVLAFREFGINEAELRDLIASETTAAMEFKGATATLPENPAKGDMYKVAGENINIKIDDVDAKLGDSIVYDGEKWFLIPSGDDIEDTWRPVTGVNNDATLTFVDGDKTKAVVAADGTVKYNHATIDAPVDNTSEEDEPTRTYITSVETDGFGHITGYKTATEVVEDTNTEYTFEGQSDEATSVYFQVTSNEEGASAEVIYLDTYSKNEADGKFVAKEEGKSLISDDEIARLAEVDNYDDEEIRGLIGDNADAIATEKERAEGIEGGLRTDVDAIKGDYLKGSDKTELTEAIATAKTELQGEIDADVKVVDDKFEAYKTSNDEALAGVKATADAAAVKTEVETALAGKVDKVEGKDLIATSEIERLATLHNYDDAEVKADIAKKADAEAMTTELGKKVDKVEGYSLVSDDEIARLAEVDNYDDTALAGRVTTAEGKIADLETESAKHATKDELGAVDAKFADYNTTVAQKAIDDEQDRRIKQIEDDYIVASDIEPLATKESVNELATTVQNNQQANEGAIGEVRDYVGTFTHDTAKTVVEYINAKTDGIATSGNLEALGARVTAAEGKITALEDGVAGLEDDIEVITGNLNDCLKTADKTELEGKITAETQRATLAEANIYTEINGIKGDYLKSTDKTELEGKITAEETRAKGVEAGLQEQITANANAIERLTNGVSADEIDGVNDLINYVNEHGTTVKGMQDDIAANTKAISDHETLAAETYETKEDATSKKTEIDGRLATLEAIDHEAYKAADAELATAIENAKTDAANQAAVVLSEAQAYADTAKADAIADAASKYETIGTAQGIVDGLKLSETYEPIGAEGRAIAAAEGKVNALAGNVYTKEEVYTKAEVEALFTWGSF